MYLNSLPFLTRFGSEWKYNNWQYALAARVIEIRSGHPWQSQIHRILKALGRNRSSTTNPDDENIAHGYKVFNDERMIEDGLPLLKGGDAFDGSGSLRSCVHDMTTECKVLIQAMRTEASVVVAKAKAKWQEVHDAWSAEREIGTQPHGLTAYVGTYTSTDLRMTLRISTLEDIAASRGN